MKKIIVIVLGIIIIAGLTYMVLNLEKGSKASDTSLIAFAIEDTASVNKIEIYDSFKDEEYTLTRNKEGRWEGPDDQCVQQSIPQLMLKTMKLVTLKGYVPKSAMENMKKLMMAQYKSVKIYQNNKWVKTWFIGQSTQDHLGTHMLLETPDLKSDNPVIMGMKGFYGILSPRFFADPRKFACTKLFSFTPEDIRSIEIVNNVDPEDSYKIEIDGPDNIVLSSQGERINNFNKDNLVFYLNGFKKFHFNQPNYTLSQQKIDSMKAKTPDYELVIKGKKSAFHMGLYRRLDPDESQTDNLVYDQTYLWGIKSDGEVVRMQYYTVGPMIEGKMIFEDKANQ